jgi:hypothetical protein
LLLEQDVDGVNKGYLAHGLEVKMRKLVETEGAISAKREE